MQSEDSHEAGGENEDFQTRREELNSASGPFIVEDVSTPSTSRSNTSSSHSSGGSDNGKRKQEQVEEKEVIDGEYPERCSSFKQRTARKRNYRTRSQEALNDSDSEMELTFEESQNSTRSTEGHDGESSDDLNTGSEAPVNESQDNVIPLSPSIHSGDEDQLLPLSRSRVESTDSDEDSDGPFIVRPRREATAARRLMSSVPPLVASVLEKKPKPERWSIVKELRKWESRATSTRSLENKIQSSRSTVVRMESLAKMEFHTGCVNGLHFNESGTRLASGSDDLKVAVWDWSAQKLLYSFDSGHKANVFQAKLLPLVGETHIVTAARDGQVRLAEVRPTGVQSTKKVFQHRGPCHKVTSVAGSPHVVLSAGEDAAVSEIDIRESKGKRILIAKQDQRKISLYSIQGHPLDSNYILVGGCDEFARVYDRRRLGRAPISGAEPVSKFCPQNLMSSTQIRAHITCCLYNVNGSEILATYNDDDIYLFDASHSEGADAIHRYMGARNSATVKGVNFFGPNSEYIVSGSDCGHIFFWDKETEAILNILPGDDNGVVNVLEPHPSFPILATSGLDDDVKLWAPVGDPDASAPSIKEVIESNFEERENDGTRESGSIDGEMLWMLWRHLNRTERRRRNQEANPENVEDSDASEENEGDDSRRQRQMECRMS